MSTQAKNEFTDMKSMEDDELTAGPQPGTLAVLVDPEDESRVRRKIDCVVLPLVSALHFTWCYKCRYANNGILRCVLSSFLSVSNFTPWFQSLQG